MSESKPVVSERVKTDAALRAERVNADRALAAERAVVNAEVDMVIHIAREDADERVSAARELADKTLGQVASTADVAENLAELHAVEDAALARERATVDQLLRIEREHARALVALLPIERDQTDRQLHTERSRSDAAVEHRDDFLGMVSHDLRNLLSGILYSAELMAKQAASSAEPAQTLANVDRIRRYSARMNRLIGDLLDVASIDAGKLAIVPTDGDPAPVIIEALELFRGAAAAKGIALISRVTPRSLRAHFDPDRLSQVLANLVSNAVKFTPPGGNVTVTAEQNGEQVRFAVTDSGVGIAGHLLERIFERFWQSREADSHGMGLGLYISRCIVIAHRGRIWAESKLGEYSTIYFTLPARSPAAAVAGERGLQG
jgi:signal transduction histidine kinase